MKKMLFVITRFKLILKTVAVLLFFSTFFSFVYAKSTSDFLAPSEQIPYYKSPTSLYPSGEMNIERLQETLLEKASEQTSYYLYKNQKISKSLIPATTSRDLSNSDSLSDLGYFMTLKSTYLRSQAGLKAPQIKVISGSVKFTALGFKNGFVLAKINQTVGYIDISDCLSKFDFAKAVYAAHPKTKTKQWFYIKNRNFDQFETVDKWNIHLSNIEGIYPDTQKAIVTTSNQLLPIWSVLELKVEAPTLKWNRSLLKGHGTVYWQRKLNTENLTQQKIKIDDLLKKEISFVSFNPKNPRQAVASAKGLFITNDGENWTEIEQFKNYSGPVLFYNEFIIFAGNYKSTDGGKTFENYIQIEKLSGAISDTIGFDPKRLQVKKIKTVKPFKVEVDIDIGSRTIKVQTPVYNQDWKVVKL